MSITIVDYNPKWAIQFEQLKTVYSAHLGKLIDDIQHVGSTSVPGLAAKPVLDIDLIIKEDQHLPEIIQQLELLGYRYCGEMGISGRSAFQQLTPHTPIDGKGTQWPLHHLYVCQQDSIALHNHLIFRDALRNNADLADRYGQLKRAIAARCTDMDQYVKEKTAFIITVLQGAGMQTAALQSIEMDNLGE
jgi:GrpB-like predicted nucleotidyltransferase (UPF0157 family)